MLVFKRLFIIPYTIYLCHKHPIYIWYETCIKIKQDVNEFSILHHSVNKLYHILVSRFVLNDFLQGMGVQDFIGQGEVVQ